MENQPITKSEAEKFCSSCGAIINVKAEICPKCGVRQHYTQASSKGKSRIAAALLAFFFGWIGIHKFYLGQVGLGFLYLIFCWTGIPAFIAFIEFIIYLCMSDETFDEKYNR